MTRTASEDAPPVTSAGGASEWAVGHLLKSVYVAPRNDARRGPAARLLGELLDARRRYVDDAGLAGFLEHGSAEHAAQG
jgi:hypothetical protein